MAKKKATEVLGGAKKAHKKGGKGGKGKKSVHRMHIRHAANGGYIAEHEYKRDDKEPAMPPQNDEFQLGDMDALQNHVAEHMDQSQQPDQAAAPQGAPAPAPQPPQPGTM